MKMLKPLVFFIVFVVMALTSCARITPYMKQDGTLLQPPEDKALVRFMSPKAVGYLFDSEKYIAYMVPKTQFDYLTEPGKHLFIASMENKAFLEADLEGGKTYYVFLRVIMGVWRSRVGFIAVNDGSEYWSKIPDYEAGLLKLTPDMEAIDKWEALNKHKATALVEQYEPVWKEQYNWEKLNPEDGR